MDNALESLLGGASARLYPTAVYKCDKITALVME